MAMLELESEDEFQRLIHWFEQETFDQHIYFEDEGITFSSQYP